ncbi:MAG: hypothetical protein IAI50_03270 [Candidatus Eremiobacteraeota bacterium]|nr:hypothetical protein [Candidatus Eremiobacteraeota bacterium]
MFVRIGASALVLGFGLSACGGGTPSSPSAAAGNVAAGAPLQGERPAVVVPATSVVVHATKLAAISKLVLGANMAIWYDITQSGTGQSLQSTGFTATRWPGGSASDEYHWQTAALCDGGYGNPNSTFDNFETDVAQPAKLDVAITLNYGSNGACNAGGDPTEAAGWVDYANNQKHYGIKYWTVGNEVYGSWEYDLHSPAHDSATYANAVATGYYPDIKAKDSSAQVGVVVEPNWSPNWDTNVLANAPYDFVEFHFYAQNPGQENDAYLLEKAPGVLGSSLSAVQADLKAAGKPNTPIYVGELGSVSYNPGKQTTSITQALYAGMSLGEMMTHGVFRSTWWLGYGGCSDSSSGNFSSSLYGWQNFGGYMIFSDGTPEDGCPNATSVPRGTLLPTTRAFELLAPVALDGEHMLAVSVGGSKIRAYAMTHTGSYALVLFNLDKSAATSVPVSIDGLTSGSGFTVKTYGKAQYDRSKNNVWTGPVSSSGGAWQGTFDVTLAPWSMNVVTVKR